MHYLGVCLFFLLLHKSRSSEDIQNSHISEDLNQGYPAQPLYYPNAPFYGGYNQGEYPYGEENGDLPYADSKETIPTEYGNATVSGESQREFTPEESSYEHQPSRYGNLTEHYETVQTENAAVTSKSSDVHHNGNKLKQIKASQRANTSKSKHINNMDENNSFENTRTVAEGENSSYERSVKANKRLQGETNPPALSEEDGSYDEQPRSYEQKSNDNVEQSNSYANNKENYGSRSSVTASEEQTKSTEYNYPSDSSIVEADKQQLQSVSQFYGDQIIPGDLPNEDDVAKKMSINEEPVTIDQYPGNSDYQPEAISTETGSIRHRIYSRKQQQQLKKHHRKYRNNKAIDKHANRMQEQPLPLMVNTKKIKSRKHAKGLSKNVSGSVSIAKGLKQAQPTATGGGGHQKPSQQRKGFTKPIGTANKTSKLKDVTTVNNNVKFAGAPVPKKNAKISKDSKLQTESKASTLQSKTNVKLMKTQQYKQQLKVPKQARNLKPKTPVFQQNPKMEASTLAKNQKLKTPVFQENLKIKASTLAKNPKLKTPVLQKNAHLKIAKLTNSSSTLSQADNLPAKIHSEVINLRTRKSKPQVTLNNNNNNNNVKASQRNLKTSPNRKFPTHKKEQSQNKKKTSTKENKTSKKRSKGECKNYLGCLESWFQKYAVSLKPLNSVSRLQSFFKEIYKSTFMVSFKSEVKNIVDKLSEMKLINWAIIYDYRPKLANWMNIEFLRMPLGIETPANLKQKVIFNRILALKDKQDMIKEKVRTLKNLVGTKRSMSTKIQCQVKDSLKEYRFLEESMENLRDNTTISEIYQEEAPALSVSGYDRNSYVWSRCAPKEANGDLYSGMYQKLMDMNSYQCVLYAFMKCVRDMEREDRLFGYRIENKKKQGSFQRYKNGFESLIQLHYDYGAKQNKLVPIDKNSTFLMERLTSAYCESPLDVTCLQEDGVTTEAALKFGDGYYCQNFFGCYVTCGKTCLLRERNLLPDERDRLMTWLSRDQLKRRQAAAELWDECCSNIQDCLPLRPPFRK